MNRTILVPIDISDSELTQRVISHVEEEAKIDDAEVHFLTVIPSLPYYASLGLAYSAELPAMDDLKAEAKSQLEEIIKKFKLPTDRVHVHVEEGSPKDRILELAKKIPAHMIIIASHRPDITTYLLGSNAAAVVRHAECRPHIAAGFLIHFANVLTFSPLIRTIHATVFYIRFLMLGVPA